MQFRALALRKPGGALLQLEEAHGENLTDGAFRSSPALRTAGLPCAKNSPRSAPVIPNENPDELGRTPPPFSQDVIEYGQTAKQAVSSGQLLTAIEVARDGLSRFGSDRMLQQQLALALAHQEIGRASCRERVWRYV